MFVLPDLPYPYNALEPVISDRTMHFHYDKHHAGYISALNKLLEGVDHPPATLEGVIYGAMQSADKKLFNAAAQAWNHTFFWTSMSASRQTPVGELADAVDSQFGGLAGLKTAFVSEGAGHFGSGWLWLAADRGGTLSVSATHDADDPLTHSDMMPLLVCDLWEHAYYLDHQNDRKGFLEAWFDALPCWEFAASQYLAGRGRREPWRHPVA